jgi:hypothetical protein
MKIKKGAAKLKAEKEKQERQEKGKEILRKNKKYFAKK